VQVGTILKQSVGADLAPFPAASAVTSPFRVDDGVINTLEEFQVEGEAAKKHMNVPEFSWPCTSCRDSCFWEGPQPFLKLGRKSSRAPVSVDKGDWRRH